MTTAPELSPGARVRVGHASPPWYRRAFAAALERERWLPLALSLLVTLAGLGLVALAKNAPLGSIARGLKHGEVRNLNAIRSAGELEPLLEPILPDPGERRFAARRLFAALPAGGGKAIADVDALSAITMRAEEVAGRSDLPTIAERAKQWIVDRPDAKTRAPMPLLSSLQYRAISGSFVIRPPGAWRGLLFQWSLIYLVAFAAMHVGAHLRGRRGDRFLLPCAQLLIGLGFILQVSLRDPVRDPTQFAATGLGIALGGVLFVIAALLRYERTDFGRYRFNWLALALGLSLALLAFGSGPRGTSAKVNLGPFQPLELIRLLLVLFLAGYFGRRWSLMRALEDRPPPERGWRRLLRLPRPQDFVPVAIGVAISIALSVLQQDLGPALLLIALFLCLYTVTRGNLALAGVGVAVIVAAFWFGNQFGFPSRTVQTRTRMWLDPWNAGADQLAHAMWAFASGGVSGTGLGLGAPARIPAAHTDLILTVVGEELGFFGALCCLAVGGLIVARGFRAARRAPNDYLMFLALGLTASYALEALLITTGVTGVLPLTGVVMPFMSYGRSAVMFHLAGLGMLWAISAAGVDSVARASDPFDRERSLARARRVLLAGFAALGAVVVVKLAIVQVFTADRTMVRESLTRQSDPRAPYRYQENPRLKQLADNIPRGDILDRNGVVLATRDWDRLDRRRAAYAALGVDLGRACLRTDSRHYPFGGLTYHLLGDLVEGRNWAASNTAFAERDQAAYLCGFDDHARWTTVATPGSSRPLAVRTRDLSALVPLWRHRYEPNHRDVRKVLGHPRDLKLSIDIRLQSRVAKLLAETVTGAGLERGAAVVLDPETGDLLASVSYPFPAGPIRGRLDRLGREAAAGGDPAASPLFDRARFGVYPPGSTFKIVTAAAALNQDRGLGARRFDCRRLGTRGIGTIVAGREVHDDEADEPHGSVTMRRAMTVSCNAYFAQLGAELGWPALAHTADEFGISIGAPVTAAAQRAHAVESAYGQAEVIVRPYQLAQVAATVAAGGRLPMVGGVPRSVTDRGEERAILNGLTAATLGSFMRDVVREGTANRLANVAPAIAGKTGTAQVANGRSHAWFMGFAPYGAASRRIAFAVLLEHGEYGGVRAAPLGGRIVEAAAELGLIAGRR